MFIWAFISQSQSPGNRLLAVALAHPAVPGDNLDGRLVPTPWAERSVDQDTDFPARGSRPVHLFGLLNINKPTGLTSRQIVDRVQQLAPRLKAGHAGTLDPLATGVLIVCVGKATRLIQYVQRMEKQYRATFLLGKQSDTEDITGNVLSPPDLAVPSEAELRAQLPHFVGHISQQPPDYSALKIQGKRAYQLARQGLAVHLRPRTITIRSLSLVRYDYPTMVLDVACGAGTYVRSLGRDIARALGSTAVMSALTRRAVGELRVEQSCCLDQLDAPTWNRHLQPAAQAVIQLPSETLPADLLQRVACGLPVPIQRDVQAAEIAALDSDGQLAAILVPAGEGQYRAVKNFSSVP